MALIGMAEYARACIRCGIEKPRDGFYINKARSDGLQSECKDCKREYDAKRYKERRDIYRAMHRKNHLRRKFGIDERRYNELLDMQNGSCAICRKTCEDEGKRLAIDHDHKTGEIRGLLCYNCNRGIGHLQDNITLLKNAIDYLERQLC